MQLIKFQLAPPSSGVAHVDPTRIAAIISQADRRLAKQGLEDDPRRKGNKVYAIEDATLTILALTSGAEVRVVESAEEVMKRMDDARKDICTIEDHLGNIDLSLITELMKISDRLEEIAVILNATRK